MKNALVALFVCSSLLFISGAEASKGSVIVEILERFFKNSDEVVDAEKGQSNGAVQGAASANTADESPDAPEQNNSGEGLDAWTDCIVTAEQKRAKVSATKMSQLLSQETDHDQIKAKGLKFERGLAKAFCLDMVQCNSSLAGEYLVLQGDYQSCLAAELQELN